jgi:signal transduction histidine kinase
VRLEARAEDGHAVWRVTDTGMGISSQDLPHVFERFYRADQARTRSSDPGGTGLGLPIARGIATQHQGEIWLESELERGTTAIVRLPLARSESS